MDTTQGYQGYDYEGEAQISLAERKRSLSPTMKRKLKRRSAIELMIGHAKNDGRLGRNHLLGHDGGTINALLAASQNLRFILRRIWVLFARTPNVLCGPAAKPDTFLKLRNPGISTA